MNWLDIVRLLIIIGLPVFIIGAIVASVRNGPPRHLSD